MAARRAAPDQTKQKRLLAVLSLVLVAVIGFWGARSLTHHKGGQTAAPLPTTSASTTGAGTAAAAPAAAAAPPSVFTVTQLSSFSGLSARDVFKSKVSTNVDSAASTSPAATAAAAAAPPKPAPTQPAKTRPAQTVAISTPATPAKALGPLLPAALLKLNGTKQVVIVGNAFPKSKPVFRLTAVGRSAMWISLLHGKFAGGGSLLKIRHGHPTKLVSSGGAKLSFVLAILRVTARHVPPQPPATTTTAATTTTVAATTTPTTTTAGTTTTGP